MTHDCLLQVHLVFSPRRDQLGGTPGTTGLPVLHLLDSSQYSICTWLYIAGLYLQWHCCGHHDRIRPSRRTGEADAKWSKYTNNFNLMFIDSFDQTSSSQMWWSGERCHASASFQECALPGRVWMGLSKRTTVNRWMNVLSCVMNLRGKKIDCN